jgi:uncharacterized protein (TIGR00725 family)
VNATLATKTVGVVGSGAEEHDDLAIDVGRLLASLGVNLLTGGGGGVMTSVSRAFIQAPRRAGICIGIIPCLSERERTTPRPGYPNRFVELPIYTHLPYSGKRGKDELSRNHINVLSCCAIIALPGSDGTASEVSLAIDYARPIIAYSNDPKRVENFPSSVMRATHIDAVEHFIRQYASPIRVPK